ncbi:dihydrolipoyl dehydrogenase [Lactarius sanguifluus]|nr:dihydrolipoyl dehydrogenase [Lactarius sanguifluus]
MTRQSSVEYVAAIKAAQLGIKSPFTACVEKRGTLGGTCLNVGWIPSKAVLNNSHIYHQTLRDIRKRIDAKEDSVNGLVNKKVDYIKGNASFVSPDTVSVQLNDGGESTMEAKTIIIATRLKSHLFPVALSRWTSNRSSARLVRFRCSLAKGPRKDLTVVEFLNSIGGVGIDEEILKQFPKSLTKQGLKFKLSTRVVVTTEAGKDGKQDSLEADVVLVAVGRRPYTQWLDLEMSASHSTRACRRSSASATRRRRASPRWSASYSGHGHVNYDTIPSVVYTYPEMAWVGETEHKLKTDGVKYKVGRFPFLANSRAKTNLGTEGQVKFLVEAETDRILGVHIIGLKEGEMIAEGVLALEHGASAKDTARICPSFLVFAPS